MCHVSHNTGVHAEGPRDSVTDFELRLILTFEEGLNGEVHMSVVGFVVCQLKFSTFVGCQ